MGSIKGITIEIGGNTSKLQESLKDVNKKSKDLQGELRQVERLLKLDPKNTELLAQKQKLLGDAVGNTKGKLKTLKEVQRQVEEQFKRGEIGESQYNAIKREVIKTQQELGKLEGKLKDVNNKWASAANSMGAFGERSEALGKKMMVPTAAITGAAIGATKMASDYQDAIAKVSTIADTTEVPLEKLKKEIMEVSNQTGISAAEIANNVYDAISAGQSTAEAVAFVKGSTDLAKAGFAEAGQSLDLMTTILNAYGMESEKSTKVSDMLIQVQNKGKVTVGELSSAMGKIIPTAKSVNVQLDQVGAGYAILTANGIKAAESTTYMNAMMGELGKTGSKSDKALRKITGSSFKELMESGKSISDVLAILDENAVKSGLSLGDMFGSAEAAKAALTLLGDDASNFNNMVDEMNNAVGTTSAALEKLQTPGESARISLNKLKNVAIQMGDVLLPIVAKVAESVGKFTDKLLGMDESTRKVIVVIALLVAAIGPVLITIGKISTGVSGVISLIGILTPALTALGPVFTVLTGPIGLTVAAIAALIAIVVHLWNTNEEFREFIIDNWEKITSIVGEMVEDFTTGMVDNFGFAWEAIKLAFEAFGLLFEGDFNGFLEKIMQAGLTWVTGWKDIGKNIVLGIWDGIKGMGDWIGGKVTGFLDDIVEGAKDSLGIHSPSRVFADVIGKNMALGVGEGFTSNLSDVNRNISRGLDSTVKVADSKVFNSKTSNIFKFYASVRSDTDIRKVAKQINGLQRGAERGAGLE